MDKEKALKAIYAALERKQIWQEYQKKEEQLKQIIQDSFTISELLKPMQICEDLEISDLNGELVKIEAKFPHNSPHANRYLFTYKDVNITLHTVHQSHIIKELMLNLFKTEEFLK